MRRYPMMVMAVAASLFFTACGGGGEAETGADGEGGVLVYGAALDGSATSGRLDPALSTSVSDMGIMYPIFDTLVHREPDGTPTPGLAESWTTPSPTSVELTLREGVTFHNGAPFDAAAVAAGLERNAQSEAQTGASLGPIVGSVEEVDPRTVRITLSEPVAGSLPLILSGREGMIVAPGTEDTADTQPVGAGPFSFVSAVPGQSLEVAKFDGYWDADAVELGGIRWVHSDAGPSTTNALMAGEIDMAEITPDQVEAIETQPQLAVASQPGQTYHKLNYNLTTPPFDDVRFRQALNHAVDREEILQAVFAGQGEVAWGPYPSVFSGHAPENEGRYAHDPERARQLLAEAGLTDVHFTSFISPTPTSRRLGEVVQAQLAEVGIQVEFQQSTDLVQEYFEDKKQPATVILWPPRPDPADTFRIQFTPGNFNNAGDYDNPALNDLVSQIRATSDAAERTALTQEASRLVVDEALDLPVAFPPLLKAHSTEVGGEIRQFEYSQMVDFTTVTKGT